MIFRAETLEEAYQKAADYFEKSVSELEIKTIQFPSKGIFGMFTQPAIIEVIKVKESNSSMENIEEKIEEKKEKKDVELIQEKEKSKESSLEEDMKTIKKEEKKDNLQEDIEEEIESKIDNEEIIKNDLFIKDIDKYKPKEEIKKSKQEIKNIENDNLIKELSIDDVIKIAKTEVNELFFQSCFDLKEIQVSKYNEETILFEFNGQDVALLIGKEGYRYNALLTMLFNWIFQKYGFRIRLEIASFLETQEEMMKKLLVPLIIEIEEKGRAKTKPFDGILSYIALDILREEFPNKYIAIKRNRNGENYIIINEFKK